MNKDHYNEDIKEGIVDVIQNIFEESKVKLQKVECPEHGQALKDFQFDRTQGRFRFDTCCAKGEKLVEEEIAKL